MLARNRFVLNSAQNVELCSFFKQESAKNVFLSKRENVPFLVEEKIGVQLTVILILDILQTFIEWSLNIRIPSIKIRACIRTLCCWKPPASNLD